MLVQTSVRVDFYHFSSVTITRHFFPFIKGIDLVLVACGWA